VRTVKVRRAEVVALVQRLDDVRRRRAIDRALPVDGRAAQVGARATRTAELPADVVHFDAGHAAIDDADGGARER